MVHLGPKHKFCIFLHAEGFLNGPKHNQTSFLVQRSRMDAFGAKLFPQLRYNTYWIQARNKRFTSFYMLKVSSEPFLGVFLGLFLGTFSWGFDGGNLWEPSVVLWAVIPLPNPWVKGLDFGVFGVLGLEVFLVGFLRFLLFGQVLVGLNLAMTPHEVFLLSPKSCSSPWSDSGDRSLDLGEMTRECCSSRAALATPVWPVLFTGLTGATLGGFLLGWTSGWVCCCPVLELFWVWVSLQVGWPV
jgi:hypothetical protein